VAAWLFTIQKEQDPLVEGERFELWTDAPRKKATGDVRRRSDGDPYTPWWEQGEDVSVYQPVKGRCVARLRLDGGPVWNAADELFYADSTVFAARDDGPTLADLGVEQAVEGGRQRLTLSQARTALASFARR
jgi:hypothetical protein